MSKEWGAHKGYYWLKEDPLRKVLTLEEQGCYFAMFSQAIAAKSEGRVETAPGKPYDRKEVARYLEVPLEVFNSTLHKCIAFGRMALDKDGVPYFVDWTSTRPTKPPMTEEEIGYARRARLSKDIRNDVDYAAGVVKDCIAEKFGGNKNKVVSLLPEDFRGGVLSDGQ